MRTMNKELPYRPCVGAMLINIEDKVFVAKRTDSSGDYWQMPQGGIDEGEIPIEALMRELLEETGTDKVQIIAESEEWRTYDLPDDLIGKLWQGKYRGQRQKWFALKFLGKDDDINIKASECPEFIDWKWVDLDVVIDLIIPFKRKLYMDIVREFRSLLEA